MPKTAIKMQTATMQRMHQAIINNPHSLKGQVKTLHHRCESQGLTPPQVLVTNSSPQMWTNLFTTDGDKPLHHNMWTNLLP